MVEFVAVCDAGSISGAARALELPRATLSRRMSGLEAELGVRLLHRSTRGLVLTDAGRELDRRARRIVAESDAAWLAVRRLDDTPRGLLRVSVVGNLLADMMISYLQEFPEVELEVHSTSRQVDLVREGIDVAIRFGPVTDPELICRRVATSRRLAVGEASYLAVRGTPETLEALAEHDCLLGFAGGDTTQRTWPCIDGSTVRVSGPLAANHTPLTRRAALAGLGLALLPWLVVHRDVAEGRLVPVLPGLVGTEHPISLVYTDREYMDPKVRAFVDRALPALRSEFEEVPSGPAWA